MIRVLKSGFYTSIQDKGRLGFASIGVPVSGAMDSYSSNIANGVLNNSLDSAVLEITFGGVKLEFLVDTFISLSGGDFSPRLNGETIFLNSKIKIQKNDILSFSKIKYGVRCYMAVKDGLQTQMYLNSRSLYQNITNHNVVQRNDLLKIAQLENHIYSSNASIKILKAHFETKVIECFIGPEFNLLSGVQKKQIFEQIFTISNDNNRMGYRLIEIIKNNLPSILTSAVLPGTVQLTPSGKIIVLMRDCQVTGGYPRILQLTEKGINQLAQKTTNNKIQFVLKS